MNARRRNRTHCASGAARALPGNAECHGAPVHAGEARMQGVVAHTDALPGAHTAWLRRRATPADRAARLLPRRQRDRAVAGLDLAVVATPHPRPAVVDE